MASMGRPVTMNIEYTAFERPRRLRSTTRLAAIDIQGALTFDPAPEGTLLRWSWELEPRGVFRFVTPLVARLGRRQEATIWAGLKRYLEGPERDDVPAQLADAAAGGA
jgi:hypothetical protein